MKTKTAFIFLVLIGLLAIASSSLADGMLYPIGQQQPSYPVPQYYPYGQQQQQPYQPYNPPYQPQPQPQPQPQQPPKPQPQPQPQPQNQQPIYDPISHMYFFPIGGEQPWYQVQPQPWQQQPQPWNQGQPQPWQQQQPPQQQAPRQDANVQVSTQRGRHNSVDLTWTIRNITNENWGKQNVDILCVNGCHLLRDQNRTRWDIPRTVKKNETLTFTVNIRQPRQGDTMTFSMVAGSKTLYTFSVRL